jgi:hypothetical protein
MTEEDELVVGFKCPKGLFVPLGLALFPPLELLHVCNSIIPVRAVVLAEGKFPADMQIAERQTIAPHHSAGIGGTAKRNCAFFGSLMHQFPPPALESPHRTVHGSCALLSDLGPGQAEVHFVPTISERFSTYINRFYAKRS